MLPLVCFKPATQQAKPRGSPKPLPAASRSHSSGVSRKTVAPSALAPHLPPEQHAAAGRGASVPSGSGPSGSPCRRCRHLKASAPQGGGVQHPPSTNCSTFSGLYDLVKRRHPRFNSPPAEQPDQLIFLHSNRGRDLGLHRFFA